MNFSYLTGKVGKLGIAKIKRRIIVGNNALVYDTFTGPDGQLLTAHTPDIRPAGAAWELLSGISPTIQANKLYSSGAGGDEIVISCSISNVLISLIKDYNKYIGIIARLIDMRNYWLLRHISSALQIYEKTEGTFTLRASLAYVPSSGTETMTVASSVNLLSISIESAYLDYSSTLYNTATKTGLRMETLSICDNFTVTPL